MQITAAQQARLVRYAGERWRGSTIVDALLEQCRIRGDRVAVIDGAEVLTFNELKDHAYEAAESLRLRGIRPGDVVSLQLPNWHEAVALMIATALTGAVVNPIVTIYRDAEVAFILADSDCELLFIPGSFRSFDHAAMVTRLRGHLRMPPVVRVRGDLGGGVRRFRGTLADFAPVAVDPDAVRLLMYTSGTTGRAKGVLHSTNTLAAEIAAVIDYWSVTAEDVVFMPSPLTHITGYLYGVELPVRSGCKVVLMDRWSVAEAAELIQTHNVTLMVGATPFLAELVAHAETAKLSLPSLRLFGCGGAPVPPDLIYRAHKVFARCVVTRIYGSTEAPTVTLGVTTREEETTAAETDGRIVGHEVRIVDPGSNRPLAKGLEGEVATRGPELFLGYWNANDEADAFTDDGFFLTGDLGRILEEDVLVITGRKKDLIIRGGENIAPKEIEDVLFEHPAVAEAAVVAVPSSRLGEGVGAFIVVRQGACVDSGQLGKHVLSHGLAIQKCPEQFFFVAELPKTASGKVRKDMLRLQAVQMLAGAAGTD